MKYKWNHNNLIKLGIHMNFQTKNVQLFIGEGHDHLKKVPNQ